MHEPRSILADDNTSRLAARRKPSASSMAVSATSAACLSRAKGISARSSCKLARPAPRSKLWPAIWRSWPRSRCNTGPIWRSCARPSSVSTMAVRRGRWGRFSIFWRSPHDMEDARSPLRRRWRMVARPASRRLRHGRRAGPASQHPWSALLSLGETIVLNHPNLDRLHTLGLHGMAKGMKPNSKQAAMQSVSAIANGLGCRSTAKPHGARTSGSRHGCATPDYASRLASKMSTIAVRAVLIAPCSKNSPRANGSMATASQRPEVSGILGSSMPPGGAAACTGYAMRSPMSQKANTPSRPLPYARPSISKRRQIDTNLRH